MNKVKKQIEDFLRRIEKAKTEIGEDVCLPLSNRQKESFLPYMLQPDDGGYYMPNLQGCLPFPIDSFYKLLNAKRPRTAEDFEGIVNLCLGELRNKNLAGLPNKESSETTASEVVVSAIYEACYLKCREGYPMEANDPFNITDGFVGPFFYIGRTILAKKHKVKSFDIRRRFFDARTSHMEFFEELNIEGDYGNYLRGRVLLDNFHKRFVIYMDEDLNRLDTKEQLIEHFELMGQKVVFRRDEHYTHDGL